MKFFTGNGGVIGLEHFKEIHSRVSGRVGVPPADGGILRRACLYMGKETQARYLNRQTGDVRLTRNKNAPAVTL